MWVLPRLPVSAVPIRRTLPFAASIRFLKAAQASKRSCQLGKIIFVSDDGWLPKRMKIGTLASFAISSSVWSFAWHVPGSTITIPRMPSALMMADLSGEGPDWECVSNTAPLSSRPRSDSAF